MAGGFLSGALWGGVVSLGVGAVASVMVPVAQAPRVDATAMDGAEAPTAPEVSVVTPDASLSAPDQVVRNDPASDQPEPPAVDTLSTIETEAPSAPREPQSAIISGLDAPSEGDASGPLALNAEDPVFPNPQALAPMLPQEPDTVSVDTAPADLPDPAPQQGTDPNGEASTTDPEAPAAVTVQEDDAQEDPAPVESETAATPEQETPPVEGTASVPQTARVDQGAETDTLTPDTPAEQQADGTPNAPEADQQATLQPVEPPSILAPATEEPETAGDETPTETEDAPEVAMLAPTVRPQLGTPAVSLTERDSAVRIRRPEAETAEGGGEEVTVINEDRSARGSDLRPIVQFGQRFTNPDGKPLMGIVLIDDGTSPTTGASGIAALRSFPYSLNIAVDSSLADATERMKLYREAGFEVMAMVDLPGGARASDVETTLGVTLAQLGEVVGVLEGPQGGLQSSREVSDQVAAILAQSGHGLVTQDKGLNTMPKLARKEGVPADPVFRDFDSKGQTATVIRRFLDQAAFKAGQEGAVIMLGRLRPDTISALLLWGLQDRAGQVAIAPISAVLTRENAGG
ncbi:YibQ protein [Sulfitobacter noctilucicola]|uniref:Polysaccharide deacetylase 2 family uncharacterized protein YibQ n=2 Tax=Sulfitobacter noctilucicola TaxID=1342301 RepID=A0A7W6M854_9RHOB|nr:YibQ protein [Sulfitobacter noctilucicola]MBB4174076.1 polysaccharide deacetylase 2 family uncharacterized protein YibQ [Sulfitobacter noctilucicola]